MGGRRLVLIAAVWSLLAASCGADQSAEPPTVAQLVELETIETLASSVSPDGEQLFYQRSDPSGPQWCVRSLPNASDTCISGESGHSLTIFSQPRWSPDSARVAWEGGRDVLVFDPTGPIAVSLTDEGVDDYAPSDDDERARRDWDGYPAWLDTDHLIFVRSGPENDFWESLLVVSATSGELVTAVPGPAYDIRGEAESQWTLGVALRSPPVVLSSREVLVGGAGAIHRVDPEGGSVEEVLNQQALPPDVRARWQEIGLELDDDVLLSPLAQMASGEILILDWTGGEAMSRAKVDGAPSFLFLFEPEEERAVPLFQPSPMGGSGWIGPLNAVLSPDRTRLLLTWWDVDARQMVVSLLDPKRESLPVDPRRLTTLWTGESLPHHLGIGGTWTEDGVVALQSARSVVLLQVEELASGDQQLDGEPDLVVPAEPDVSGCDSLDSSEVSTILTVEPEGSFRERLPAVSPPDSALSCTLRFVADGGAGDLSIVVWTGGSRPSLGGGPITNLGDLEDAARNAGNEVTRLDESAFIERAPCGAGGSCQVDTLAIERDGDYVLVLITSPDGFDDETLRQLRGYLDRLRF